MKKAVKDYPIKGEKDKRELIRMFTEAGGEVISVRKSMISVLADEGVHSKVWAVGKKRSDSFTVSFVNIGDRELAKDVLSQMGLQIKCFPVDSSGMFPVTIFGTESAVNKGIREITKSLKAKKVAKSAISVYHRS